MIAFPYYVINSLIMFPVYVSGYLIPIYCFGSKTSSKKAYKVSFVLSLIITLLDNIYSTYVLTGVLNDSVYKQTFIGILYLFMEVSVAFIIFYYLKLPWVKYLWISIIGQLALSFIIAPFSVDILPKEIISIRTHTTILPEYIKKCIIYLLVVYALFFLLFYPVTWACKKLPHYFSNIPEWLYIFFYAFHGLLLLTSKINMNENINNFILQSYQYNSNLFLLFIYFVIVIIVVFFYTVATNRKQLSLENLLLREQIQNQYEYYMSLTEQNETIGKLYHDIGNHITTLNLLFHADGKEEAAHYLQTLSSYYVSISRKSFCTNPVLDALLFKKNDFCDKHQINCQIDVKLPSKLSITDMDLISIFSNLLDNAIEECVRNKIATPYINLKADYVGDYIIIKAENSKADFPSLNKKATWKQDSQLHGCGLKILHKTALHYGGCFSYAEEKNRFMATITLDYNNPVESKVEKKMI